MDVLVQVHPDRPLVCSAGADGFVVLVHTERNKVAAVLAPPLDLATSSSNGTDDDGNDDNSNRLDGVESLAFNRDGSLLAAAHNNGSISLR